MTGRIIETDADIEEGVAHLAAICPRMAHARDLCGPVPLRRRPDGFAALLSAIVSQQLSTSAADAIWTRMQAAGLDAPAPIRQAGDDDLRAAGLSPAKDPLYSLAFGK